MQNIEKERIREYLLFAAIILAAALILIFGVFGRAPDDGVEESIQAIRSTILEKSLQCYVIEGAYPDDISWLEEHYGLIINKNDYYVVYRPIAENVPPQISVVHKNGKDER